MKAHARAQAGHVDDAEVAVHQQVWHPRLGMNTEGGRLDKANLTLLAAFEPVLAQVLEGVIILKGQAKGGRCAGLEQFFVIFVRVNAIQDDIKVLVALCLA